MSKFKSKRLSIQAGSSIAVGSFEQIQTFINGLESKVGGILKAQQNDFILSYKAQMHIIKQQFDKMGDQIKKKDIIIENYEKGEKISRILERLTYLQAQEKTLLSHLEKKKSQIRELHIENQVQKSEVQRLSQRVKQLIRSKCSMMEQHQQFNEPGQIFHLSSCEPIKTKKFFLKTRQDMKSNRVQSTRFKSEKTETSLNQDQSEQLIKLQKQVAQLKKQNRDLVASQSKYFENKSEMENFFYETISEMKKTISSKKMIKECSFEDFKKEDKISLLIKILSNDNLLLILHTSLFGKQFSPLITQEKIGNIRPLALRNKFGLDTEGHFPNIGSARVIH